MATSQPRGVATLGSLCGPDTILILTGSPPGPATPGIPLGPGLP